MHFFLNYGGPGGRFFSKDKELTQHLHNRCKKYYKFPIRQSVYQEQGMTITVHTYGLHRALHVEIPDTCNDETWNVYQKAQKQAEYFSNKKYKLLGNNCVTSVATVLNTINPNITPHNIIYPWDLDQQLKMYSHYNRRTAIANGFDGFIENYQKKFHQESFSFFRKRGWANKPIKTSRDIIHHAYGRSGGTGERTKTVLLDEEWVVEDKNGLLQPGPKAPVMFKIGLQSYNGDWLKVQQLKKLYQQEASFFSFRLHSPFKDHPDFETAKKRLELRAQKNPKGASAKTLLQWEMAEQKQQNSELSPKPY
ncbi:hypothetical protein [Legionella fairfieldensis]|uniref:hypothetical protein n=1 Tax=Legionella fairfieldensis TaxID=45064 RepID=UPI000AAF05A7|nr:hypothetical protein [Legionella fairfieldensis]